MGKPTGFLEVERLERGYEKAALRKKTWREFVHALPEPVLRAQASRSRPTLQRSATTGNSQTPEDCWRTVQTTQIYFVARRFMSTRSAKALGLTVPQSIFARADEVIE